MKRSKWSAGAVAVVAALSFSVCAANAEVGGAATVSQQSRASVTDKVKSSTHYAAAATFYQAGGSPSKPNVKRRSKFLPLLAPFVIGGSLAGYGLSQTVTTASP